METIRNYLESMFAALPNTEEVRRAKQELGAMMEDKYSELIAEGKSENEAIGIIISEFGNLEELSEELGLGGIMHDQPADDRKVISISEAREYLNTKEHTSLLTGIGVLLCIICPTGVVIGGFMDSWNLIAAGLAMLFICIAVGVGLFIYSGITLGKWKAIGKRRYRMDYGTATSIRNDWDRMRSGYALLIIIGVICIIISVVPITIMGYLFGGTSIYGALGTSLLFILIGIGVFLLVFACGRKEGYMKLLRLNDAGTMGGSYSGGFRHDRAFGEEFGDDNYYFENPKVAAVMSVYWPIMTGLYLSVSFLTWRWGLTWIIWPLAGIVNTIINRLLGTPVQEV